ncbi:protein-export chaperone SecB [Pararhodospirillum oryzae]|uniref:Protein-export protein SecB n=1 Tax=Pararhodospirillum oryzae TaxID=478448 RepID=A0A512H605_9PROT|nr:protein-export chaperone SecB [Pararhodospirillum oryzae]GEO80872.1 protein-export protein SecB [Pararhodospirillum oryzae]
MSQDTPAAGADRARPQAPLMISHQYTKDLSFEAPNTPQIFTQFTKQPEISINVDVKVEPVQENVFEVILHFEVDSRIGDTVAFLVELKYAAVVSVHVPEEHVRPMLLIEVPHLLFPYARNILSDTTRDAGFPPLMLQPLDFAAMYRNRFQAAQAQGPEDAPPVGHA